MDFLLGWTNPLFRKNLVSRGNVSVLISVISPITLYTVFFTCTGLCRVSGARGTNSRHPPSSMSNSTHTCSSACCQNIKCFRSFQQYPIPTQSGLYPHPGWNLNDGNIKKNSTYPHPEWNILCYCRTIVIIASLGSQLISSENVITDKRNFCFDT